MKMASPPGWACCCLFLYLAAHGFTKLVMPLMRRELELPGSR